MKGLIIALLLLAPFPVWADLQLSELTGEWSGQGIYAEGISSAKMRCKLNISGTNAMVRMSGRCGSSLGAERMVLDFSRGSDGVVSVDNGPGAPATDSPINGLHGTPETNRLIVRGSGGDETVKIELLLNVDGTLRFATQRTWPGKKGTSVVTLIRR